MNPHIFFSSVLTSGYREQIGTLLFFNSHQEKVQGAISATIDRYGLPQIVNEGGLLRVVVGARLDVQTLFALDRDAPGRELIGVIVYVRPSPEHFTILHVAVRDDYSASGCYRRELLTLRLINQVREIASRIKGVRWVRLSYQSGRISGIPVRHPGTTDRSCA